MSRLKLILPPAVFYFLRDIRNELYKYLPFLRNITFWRYKTYYFYRLGSFSIRPETTDRLVFDQVFINKEYEYPYGITPKLIIDGGANVGYASLWFADQYPNANIIAIEPEISNFNALQHNIKRFPKITAMKAALWHDNTYIRVRNIGLGEWGFITEETTSDDQNGIRAVTIDSLLLQSGCERIDILKLDIEGAELEVFSGKYDRWLSKVQILIIELHDNIKPGCSTAFYEAVRKYNFVESQKGENIILMRKN